MDNRCNEIFPVFSLFNSEFSLGNRLIDVFSNRFLFHSLNRKSNHDIKSYLYHLNHITLQASLNPQLVVVVTDASIKNQVAISISMTIQSLRQYIMQLTSCLLKLNSLQ